MWPANSYWWGKGWGCVVISLHMDRYQFNSMGREESSWVIISTHSQLCLDLLSSVLAWMDGAQTGTHTGMTTLG